MRKHPGIGLTLNLLDRAGVDGDDRLLAGALFFRSPFSPNLWRCRRGGRGLSREG